MAPQINSYLDTPASSHSQPFFAATETKFLKEKNPVRKIRSGITTAAATISTADAPATSAPASAAATSTPSTAAASPRPHSASSSIVAVRRVAVGAMFVHLILGQFVFPTSAASVFVSTTSPPQTAKLPLSPPASPTSDTQLLVNLTSALPSGVVSIVTQYHMERQGCHSPSAWSLGTKPGQVCPSVEVGEDGQSCIPPVEDPLRIPRIIRQAVCLCIHCTGMGDQPCCKEHHVTIPVLHCDKDPEVEPPSTCTMSLQQISESCVCTRRYAK